MNRCHDDISTSHVNPREQKLVDQFWKESLLYLEQFVQALETPTGQCKDSAQATIQTCESATKIDITG